MVEGVDVDVAAVELYAAGARGVHCCAQPAREGCWRRRRYPGQRRGEGAAETDPRGVEGNVLVRADPGRIHELTELGEQLRQAHVSGKWAGGWVSPLLDGTTWSSSW